MLKLFRTNQSSASLLLFLYALLLQLPLFWQTGGVEAADAGGGTYVGRWLGDLAAGSRLGSLGVPPLLIALVGLLANAYCDRQRLSRIPTQLPGMAVVLLWAVVPVFHVFDPQQLGLLLLLLATRAMGSTYKSNSTEVARFDVGFLLGVASLLQPTYLIFVPAFVVGISIFQSASPRKIFQLVTGVAIAYFLFGSYAYLRGDVAEFYLGQLAGFGYGKVEVTDPPNLIGLVALIVALLVMVARGGKGRALLTIAGAKNVAFQYWLLFFTLPVALLTPVLEARDAQVMVLPLGITTGLWLARQPYAAAGVYHLLYFMGALTLSAVYLFW